MNSDVLPKVFVDANVLLYSEDSADLRKQEVAIEWLTLLWAQRLGAISTQVINEFYVNATKKLKPPLPTDSARKECRRYSVWQPWVIDQATIESAWDIETRYGLHYGDCLVVAAAQHLGCRYLLSEDMGHEQFYGSVQVINPFKASIPNTRVELIYLRKPAIR